MFFYFPKTEFIRGSASFFLGLLAQFLVCTMLWQFCCCNEKNLENKRLNVQLILPVDEIEEPLDRKSLFKDEEENLEMLQTLQEPELIIPDDPFEQQPIMEKPVIPETPKPEIKKKKIVKQETKKVEIVNPEPKPVEITETQPAIPVPQEVKKVQTEPKTAAAPKPVLTKAQINENSKYLSRVMKIFEKNKKYPENARRRHLEAKIIVAFAITKDGRTENVKARTATPKELADAAEQLIKDAKLPTPPSCWPIGASVEIPISYKIK